MKHLFKDYPKDNFIILTGRSATKTYDKVLDYILKANMQEEDLTIYFLSEGYMQQCINIAKEINKEYFKGKAKMPIFKMLEVEE